MVNGMGTYWNSPHPRFLQRLRKYGRGCHRDPLGNVNRLSPFFDARVDISLPDKTDTYSKAQAEMVIGDFFNNNEVQNFKITQQGESTGTFFCTGLLQTRAGNYRTTLFFKQKGDKSFLQEIRFQVKD